MRYTKEQLSFLRKGYRKLSLKELTKAFNIRFAYDKKEKIIRSVIRNHKIKSGRTGHFQKGHITWNKGTKGLTHANKTSFKKGSIPANVKPIEAERIDSKTGAILIKVKERDPYTGFPTRYKYKNVYVWEKKHGKAPPGMVVAHKDGNNHNCNIKNLMLISRAVLLYLNRRDYKNLPDKLKPNMVMLARLKTLIGKRQREKSSKE